MYFLKRAWFYLLESLDPFFDNFSTRLCFFCKTETKELLCESCLAKEFSFKQKQIDYKMLDSFFEETEQVFHPSIFFLCNFYQDTRYLITKAKYSRPHYAKTLANYLARSFIANLKNLFLDGYSEEFLATMPESVREVDLFLTYTPMHQLKQKERSFNFAYELAKYFSREIELEFRNRKHKLYLQTNEGLLLYGINSVVFLEDFFCREKKTKALFKLAKEDRVKELKSAFSCQLNYEIKNDTLNLLLIIDDICTTGSTLMELMKTARRLKVFDELSALTLYGRNLK